MPDLEKYGLQRVEHNKKKDEEYQKILEEIRRVASERNLTKTAISSVFGYCFNCWHALQYYHGCVPLLVKLRIENVEINL